MTSAVKEGIDPNTVPNSAMRKRSTPGSVSPTKRLQKRRMSMRNRRVSFAPDPELTMVHTFEKDDYHPGVHSPATFPIIAEADPTPVMQQPQHQPPPPSPEVVDMDITQPLPAVLEDPQEDATWNPYLAGPGDITAAVPSLASLAEDDELAGHTLVDNQYNYGLHPDYDNVTAAVPGLGALLEEDEAAADGHGQEHHFGGGYGKENSAPDMELTMPLGSPIEIPAVPSPGALISPQMLDYQQHPAAPAEYLHSVPEEPELEQLQMRNSSSSEYNRRQYTSPSEIERAPAPAAIYSEEDSPLPAVNKEQGMQSIAKQGAPGTDDEEENGSLPQSTPSEMRQEGQANKWGFVPGDDDTMELDLEGHGRMIMGDRTYAGMYGDGVTRTTMGGDQDQDPYRDDSDSILGPGGRVEVDVTLDDVQGRKNMDSPGAVDGPADGQHKSPRDNMLSPDDGGVPPVGNNVDVAGEGAPPNWTMPAFLPPYLTAGGGGGAPPSDHPALLQSPAMTNSSLNTLSTKRLSVDVRRTSVNSRLEPSVYGGAGTGGGLFGTAGISAPTAAPTNGVTSAPAPAVDVDTGRLSDVTEDLLADDDSDEEVMNGGGNGGDLLAGLQQQVRMLSRGSPAPAGVVQSRTSVPPQMHQQQGHRQEMEGEYQRQEEEEYSDKAPQQEMQQQQQQQQQQLAEEERYRHHEEEMMMDIEEEQGGVNTNNKGEGGGDDAMIGGGDDHDHTAGLLQASPEPSPLNDGVNGHQGLVGATKTPFSVGYADSSFNPTGALLRTGGTTDLLLHGMDTTTGDLAAGNRNRGTENTTTATRATHGTTRLLRMDATASSVIAAGAKSLLHHQNIMENEEYTAPLAAASPQQSNDINDGHNKMSNSPPASALSAGSLRHHAPYHHHGANSAMRGSPSAVHSVRSMRSGGSMLHPAAHVTPATLHRMARTPGSVMAGSMMAGASAGGPYMAPPGSAIAARYPGSAVAQGRLSQGFTPSLPPITFQDFAKIVEVQFLDNLRRGSSINYADLAPNPLPRNLAEAYTLLCITSPHLAELDTAVQTLRSEASRLRANSSEMELILGSANPPIFRHVQTASLEQLEAFRSNVGLLKKVCRAKALVLLKDVRCQMEESKAARLAQAVDRVKTDLTFLEEQAKHRRGVAAAAEKYAREMRERLQQEAEARAVESERRKRVAAARAALEESRVANAERVKRLEETTARAAEQRRERETLEKERVQNFAAATEAREFLDKDSANKAAAVGGPPREVLSKLQLKTRVEACLGVKIEHTVPTGAGTSVVLRVGPIFRLRLEANPAGVRGTVELVAEKGGERSFGGKNGTVTGTAQRSLAAAVAGYGLSGGEAFFVDPAGAPGALQATISQLQRCSDLAAELCGVHGGCRHLVEVSAAPGGVGAVRVLFAGLDAGVRFAVTLAPGPAYPLGHLLVSTKIYFDGDGQVTAGDVAAAVARVPAGPGRLRAVCAELSDLVDVMAPKAAGKRADAFRSAFGNPLFGTASGAAAVAYVQ